MRTIFLADVFDHFTNSGVGMVVLGVIGALTIWVLALTAIERFRTVFGRKPPIEEDLRHYSATVAKLQSDLAKLPDDKKFEKLVEQLGTFATVTQLAALSETFHREVKNVDAYAHKEIHDIRNVIGARIVTLEVGSIERGELLAKLDERTLNQGRVLGGFSEKLDKVVDRMTDKFMEIIRTFQTRDE